MFFCYSLAKTVLQKIPHAHTIIKCLHRTANTHHYLNPLLCKTTPPTPTPTLTNSSDTQYSSHSYTHYSRGEKKHLKNLFVHFLTLIIWSVFSSALKSFCSRSLWCCKISLHWTVFCPKTDKRMKSVLFPAVLQRFYFSLSCESDVLSWTLFPKK